MVKNYKLALIGLLASCSLSNAMLNVVRMLPRFNPHHKAPIISGSRYHSTSTGRRSKPKTKKRRVVLVTSNPYYMSSMPGPLSITNNYQKYNMPDENEMIMKEKIRQAIGDEEYENGKVSERLGYCEFKLSNKQKTKLENSLLKIFNNNKLSKYKGYFRKNEPPIVFVKNDEIGKVGFFRDLNLNRLFECREEGDEELNGIFKSDEKDKDS